MYISQHSEKCKGTFWNHYWGRFGLYYFFNWYLVFPPVSALQPCTASTARMTKSQFIKSNITASTSTFFKKLVFKDIMLCHLRPNEIRDFLRVYFENCAVAVVVYVNKGWKNFVKILIFYFLRPQLSASNVTLRKTLIMRQVSNLA